MLYKVNNQGKRIDIFIKTTDYFREQIMQWVSCETFAVEYFQKRLCTRVPTTNKGTLSKKFIFIENSFQLIYRLVDKT